MSKKDNVRGKGETSLPRDREGFLSDYKADIDLTKDIVDIVRKANKRGTSGDVIAATMKNMAVGVLEAKKSKTYNVGITKDGYLDFSKMKKARRFDHEVEDNSNDRGR